MSETPKGFLASLGKHKFIMAALLTLGAALIAFGVYGAGEGDAKGRTEYEKALEKRVEQLCLSVAGIDEARVLVTVEGAVSQSASGYYSQQSTPVVRGVAAVVTRGDDPAVRRTVTELISSSLGIATSRVSVAPCK